MLDTTKIEKLRMALGLTQEEAARRAGLPSRARWNDIESGRKTNITLHTLDAIAQALEVHPSKLIGKEVSMLTGTRAPRPRPPKSRLLLVRRLVEYKIDELERLVHTVESGVQREAKRFDEWVQKTAEGFDDEQRHLHFDHYVDEHSMLSESVPQMSRQSNLLTIYGIFEHAGAETCRDAYLDKLAKVEPPAWLHPSKVRSYLEDQVGLPASAFGKAWDVMVAARPLRNFIAHNGARLRMTPAVKEAELENAKQFVESQPMLSLDRFDDLQIEKGFCDYLVECTRESIGSIYSGLVPIIMAKA